MEKVFHIVLSLIRLTLHLIERYLNILSPVLCFGCLNSPAPSKIGKPKLMTVLNMYVSLLGLCYQIKARFSKISIQNNAYY